MAEENDKHYRGVQSHNAPDVSHDAWVGLDSLDGGIKANVDDNGI